MYNILEKEKPWRCYTDQWLEGLEGWRDTQAGTEDFQGSGNTLHDKATSLYICANPRNVQHRVKPMQTTNTEQLRCVNTGSSVVTNVPIW